MKWRNKKLATITTNSGFSEGTILPSKRNFFTRTSYRISRGIVTGLQKKNTYVEFISSLLIILFIYTGLNKIIDHDTFKFQIGRSPYLQNLSNLVAFILPLGELLIALALIMKATRLLGLYLSFFLMALFTGYVWIMLHESYYLPCSCGGILAAMSWNDHLIFNCIFTTLSIIGVILQSKLVLEKKKVIRSTT